MPRKLRVYGTIRLNRFIVLKRPILTAAASKEEAAKVLKVTVHHLSRYPMPAITQADRERALAAPGQRIFAQDPKENPTCTPES